MPALGLCWIFFFLTILEELVSDSASSSDIPSMFRLVGDVTSDLAIIICLEGLVGATKRRLIELFSTEVFLSFSGFNISVVVECR